MLKTFGVHSKWRNIEQHWNCILTALLTAFSIVLQHSTHYDLIRARIEILGLTLCTNSSNMAGSTLRQLKKDCRSSTLSSSQFGLISIQLPALLCQPWTGLISSGSFPLSFTGLLCISFKQILLEDSSLEQSNIVQGVHTLQQSTNEMLHLAAFYSLIG